MEAKSDGGKGIDPVVDAACGPIGDVANAADGNVETPHDDAFDGVSVSDVSAMSVMEG